VPASSGHGYAANREQVKLPQTAMNMAAITGPITNQQRDQRAALPEASQRGTGWVERIAVHNSGESSRATESRKRVMGRRRR
jgi:hypothetical protein